MTAAPLASALDALETATARLEDAVAAVAATRSDTARLRQEVLAVIAELDQLIGEADDA